MISSVDWSGEMVQIVLYLLALIAIALLIAWIGKRLQTNAGTQHIRILDAKTVAPGVGVRLLQVGKRRWLVGVSRERISMLAELTPEEMKTDETDLEMEQPGKRG